MTKSTAIITGGGGGMGLACARRLASRHQVVLAELDAKRLDGALEALSADGVRATALAIDISDATSVASLVETSQRLGTLGALVHTAGLSPTMASGERIWEVNLTASARLLEAFGPLVAPSSVAVLIASQAGHFLRDSATAELTALLDAPLAGDLIARLRDLSPDWLTPGSAYAASKLGVMRLAVRTALDWGPKGGRVVSLSPGIIDTAMGRQEYDAQPFMETMVAHTPLQRMGRENEVARVVDFLCSDAASFVTASDFLVDGGSTEALRHMAPTRPIG